MVPADNQDGYPTSDGAADEENEDSSLDQTGKLFGGLIADIRRKAPWYASDFRDGLHIQCLASAFFMYFGCLVPMIMFGGLLGIATEYNIAAFECLVGGAICGVTYHLFCGQPLTIISATGPVLIFETVVYRFCMQFDWYYLGFRFWIGLWICLIFLIFVAFDLSFLVCYITRFTEESFAALIAIIFICEAFMKQFQRSLYSPELTALHEHCICQHKRDSGAVDNLDFNFEFTTEGYNQTSDLDFIFTGGDCIRSGGHLVGEDCDNQLLGRDSNLYSKFFFLGTFLLSILLKRFKKARFLPFLVRSCISDFAVVAAIFIMVVIDASIGLRTTKLLVPDSFRPTRPDRDWIIDPFGGGRNPWFTVLAAFPAGVFAAILMFMDQHIPTVIITRKDKKLKKGSGFHLDLLVIAIQIAVCSAFGMPWFVGATILSINHVNSLTMETEPSVAGERPVFIGIREQRVTGILVFLLVGLSVFMTSVLKFLPMSVLYGVLLYMGVASFQGMQFVKRLRLRLLPKKCWGKDRMNFAFIENVEMRRINLFTIIQIVCVFTLFIIAEIPLISILFPLLVVALCVVRKLLERVFTYEELLYLDDILPGSKRRRPENGTRTENMDDLELQADLARMASLASNGVVIGEETPNDVMHSESRDVLPPDYDAVVRQSDDGVDDLMPPSYDTVAHLSDRPEDRTHTG